MVLTIPVAKPPPAKAPPSRAAGAAGVAAGQRQPAYSSSGSPVASTAIVAAVVSLLVVAGIGALGVTSGLLRFGPDPSDRASAAQAQVVTAEVRQVVAPAATPKLEPATLAQAGRDAAVDPEVPRPQVLSRSAWGAENPTAGMVSQRPGRIVLTHEESSTLCCDGDLAARIQANDRIHREQRGWADIAWHYIIAPDGRIFAGRDAGYQADSSYARVNPTYPLEGTIVVGILGNYNLQEPSAASLDAIIQLMAWLCDEYDIPSSEIYTLRDLAPVHIDRQIGTTTSPGDNMRDSDYFREAVQSITGR